MKKIIGAIGFSAALLAAGAAGAVVPALMPVQGVLADTDGNPINGPTQMTFSIYTTATGTTPVWTDVYNEGNAVDVQDGFFTVYLGELDPTGNPFGIDPAATELWLGIRIGTEAELPRIRLASVPYALEAQACRQWGALDGDDATSLAALIDTGCADGYYLQGFDTDGAPVCMADQGAVAGTITAVNGTAPIVASTDTGVVTVSVTIGTTSGTVAAGDHGHDHGTLSGLSDDDHTQYLALAQNEVVSGIPSFNGGTSGSLAPFAVDSTTVVTSLNADLLDGNHASAFVAAPATCTNGYVLQFNGTSFACVAFDHGGLAGLSDDDHTQYFALAQNETVSGTPAFNGGTSGASAPFTVDSTYVVGSLNADLLDGSHASAFAANAHTHSNYWATTGNAGLSGPILGTTDNVPLDLYANNARALRILPSTSVTYQPNLIGGSSYNVVGTGTNGATVAGGGGTSTNYNWASDNFCTVGGGYNNHAGDYTLNSTATDYQYATVAGGSTNRATGEGAAVGGGANNTIYVSMYSTIAGGYSNYVENEGLYNTIGGGRSNAIMSYDYNTVAGGYGNEASGGWSATGGGSSNTSSGNYSTIPGGYSNGADGIGSYAHGYRAKANSNGCWAWADYSNTGVDFTCGTANRFQARAAGGVYFYTNSASSTGVYVSAGGGSWTSVSDRNRKKDINEVDARDVLEKVEAMPVSTWRYTTEESGALHMGPMAQDFHAAFGLGDDERSITSIDADGVALAAVKGLSEKVSSRFAQLEGRDRELIGRLEAQNRELAAANAALEARLGKMESRIARVENQGGKGGEDGNGRWWLLSLGLGVVLLAGGEGYRRRRRRQP